MIFRFFLTTDKLFIKVEKHQREIINNKRTWMVKDGKD